MNTELRPLAADDGLAVWRLLQAIPRREHGFVNDANGLPFDRFPAWLAMRLRQAAGEDGLSRLVPMDTCWLQVDGSLVGMGRLFHRLDPGLHVEGHIGYAIRPDQRGKGYGRLLLGLLLDRAAARGLESVRIACRKDNPASLKCILGAGGVLADANTRRRIFRIDVPIQQQRNDPWPPSNASS